MLLLHKPEVQLLAKEYDKDPMTERLKEAHIHRLEYAGFISTQLQYIVRIKKRELTDEIHIAQLVTRLHLFELRTNNRAIVNVKLEMFLKKLMKKL